MNVRLCSSSYRASVWRTWLRVQADRFLPVRGDSAVPVWCIGSWEKDCPTSPESRSLLNTWRNVCAIYSNIQNQLHMLSSKNKEPKSHTNKLRLVCFLPNQQCSSLVVLRVSGETGWIQMRVQTEALLNRKYKHW